MNKNTQDKLAILLIIVVNFIIYFNSLGNTFVFDDIHSIRDNLFIKEAQYIPLFLKGHYTSLPLPRGMFRPLLLITFSFNYFFSGLQPLGYHIINILLHFLNGVLFYSLFRFLKKDIPFGLALIICLLFIVHPINSETVNYITCRSDLLVTFFILSSFLSYVRGKFLLPVFLYIFTLLTKETAIVFPLLAYTYDFIMGVQQESADRPSKKRVIFYIALIGISISYLIYRRITFGLSASIVAPLSSPLRSLWSNVLTQSAVTLFYLRLFIWPYPLTIHHAFPELNSIFNPLSFLSVLGIFVIICLIFVLKKRYSLISLGIAWYLLCLFPKFYAPLYVVAAEHHFYLSGFGIYLILAVICQGLYLRLRRKFLIIATGIISVFALLVWFRNYEWKDAFSLWKSAARVDPGSAIAQHDLGAEYLEKGMYQEAQEHIIKAMSLTNNIQTQVLSRMGLAKIMWESKRKFAEAEAILKEALTLNPKDYRIYLFLGSLYEGVGREQEAEEIWKKGLNFHPHSADIRIKLGVIYLRKHDFKEARSYFLSAIKSNPDSYLAFFGLGLVSDDELDTEGAIEAYKKSIKLNPAYAPSHCRLGTLYAQKADPRALRHLKEAVKLDPNFAEAYNNLAVLYASMEPPKLELAREHAQRALDLGYPVNKEFLKVIALLQSEYEPNETK